MAHPQPSMTSAAIGPDAWVALTYVLFDEQNELVEKSPHNEPLTYVHGYAQILPGLERGLEGLRAGQRTEIVMEAADAFGERDDSGVFEVDKDDFPDPSQVAPGDEFWAQSPAGEPITMRIVEVLPDAFRVDTNHPLAGQKVKFEVEINEVRPASEAEIAVAQLDLEQRATAHDDHCCEDHNHGDHELDQKLVQLSRKH
jgi:FKBP-type peptidyl-prolyl cis-trans isomerase SlyD